MTGARDSYRSLFSPRRGWQATEFPAEWNAGFYRCHEYAGVDDRANWDDARQMAVSYGGDLAALNDAYEWLVVDGTYGWLTSVWLGGYQDPNEPNEPLGGWKWADTGQPLEDWCNPAFIGQGFPPWHSYHGPHRPPRDPGGYDEPAEGVPPPGDDGGGDGSGGRLAALEAILLGEEPDMQLMHAPRLQPDDKPLAGADRIAMGFWAARAPQGNWFDAQGTALKSYIIERPMFVRDGWRDYDGDEIYADWTMDLWPVDPNTWAPDPRIMMQRNYIAGTSFADVVDGVPQTPTYFHNDQIGTTRVLSDQQSAVSRRHVYTAFGELIWTDNGPAATRYGYVGAEGYQEDPATGLVHVGWRYYDSSIGRFLQRDPIGIQGGLNVYGYVADNPTHSSDPSGLVDEGAPPWPGGHNPWLGSAEERRGANRGAAAATATIVIGGAAVLAGPEVVGSAAVRQFIRVEAHQIGGLRHLGRLLHINVCSRHIILSPRYWWWRFKQMF